MTTQEIASMVAEIGVPYAYYQFDQTGQEPPFVCFFFTGDDDFKADNSNYQKIERLVIELYTDNKDFELEGTVESVLSLHDLVWSRSETDLGSERMHEVIYETEVVITEED